jgi:hypothetical protein
MSLDPLTIIVEADDGDLFAVAVTVSGNDITFGAPSEVKVVYEPVDDGAPTSASHKGDPVIVFASRADSRKGVPMDPVELRKSLGLADDATDEDVTAKIAELSARPEPKVDDKATADDPVVDDKTPPATLPVAASAPAGTVTVDKVAWDELVRKADDGALAAKTMRDQERARFIGEVVAAGRLSKANTDLRASLEREWDRDPETARKVAANLARVVHTTPTGHDEAPDTGDDDALYVGLFGKDGA